MTIAENLLVKSDSDRQSGGRGVWSPQMRELLAARRLMDAVTRGRASFEAAGFRWRHVPPAPLPLLQPVCRQR